MYWIDIVFLSLVSLGALHGWRNGAIRIILSGLCGLGSIAVACLSYSSLAVQLGKWSLRGPWLLPIAFIIAAFLTWIVLFFLFRLIRKRIPDKVHRHHVNKWLGLIPGCSQGALFAAILASILLIAPQWPALTRQTQQSSIAKALTTPVKLVNQRLAPVFDEAIRTAMRKRAGENESHRSIQLSFTCANARPSPALERQMLDLINQERRIRGLKPLSADVQERAVARAHSNDMFMRGFFAHTNPDGQDPFDRMEAARIRFSAAGENLALAQTLAIAHHNLMNSPPHRENILNPNFKRVGIGILDGGFYGLMISQEFRN